MLNPVVARRVDRAKRSYNKTQAKKILSRFIPDAQKWQPLIFYGNNLRFVSDTHIKERCLMGPAETGKTIALLYYLNWCAWNYPGMQGAILRNVRADLYGSALVTFHTKILPKNPVNNPGSIVRAYGGEKPEKYIYPNQSVIWVGGLDKPGGALSSERDIIYVNQAEEISETARNKLLTRVTGRSGFIPNAQLIYDANPDDPDLWIERLAREGKLSLYRSQHKDNPTLYQVDPESGKITDKLTAQGEITIGTLQQLTGVDRERLYLGLSARDTGLIYADQWRDGDEDGNVTEAAEYIPGGGEIYWSVDDGYSGKLDDSGYFTAQSHPRAFLLTQLRADGTLCIFYEDLKCKILSDAHIKEILKLSQKHKYPLPDFVAVDKAAAELKGRLHAEGIYTRNSPPSVDESIKELRAWLSKDENGRRRVLVHPRCKHLRKEFVSYRKDTSGKIIKAHDHALDALRYLVWSLRHEY